MLAFLEKSFSDLRAKAEKERTGQYGALERTDVAPNGSFFSTAQNSRPLSAQDVVDLKSGDLMLFYAGLVTYTDAYELHYETETCYFYSGSDPKTWHIWYAHNTIK